LDNNKQKKPVLLALLLMLAAWGAEAAPPTDNEVKAAFIHNIAKFVEWPAGAPRNLKLCLLGQDPLGGAAEVLQGKAVGGLAWEVAPVKPGANLKECRVLFIAASESDGLRRVLEGVKGSPVLTVGDSGGFAEQGGVVNFYLEQNKVRFEINVDAARRAGLKISSQLLKLARIVQEGAP
jgi:hypothetical protein